jgi:hypothetical protein
VGLSSRDPDADGDVQNQTMEHQTFSYARTAVTRNLLPRPGCLATCCTRGGGRPGPGERRSLRSGRAGPGGSPPGCWVPMWAGALGGAGRGAHICSGARGAGRTFARGRGARGAQIKRPDQASCRRLPSNLIRTGRLRRPGPSEPASIQMPPSLSPSASRNRRGPPCPPAQGVAGRNDSRADPQRAHGRTGHPRRPPPTRIPTQPEGTSHAGSRPGRSSGRRARGAGAWGGGGRYPGGGCPCPRAGRPAGRRSGCGPQRRQSALRPAFPPGLPASTPALDAVGMPPGSRVDPLRP